MEKRNAEFVIALIAMVLTLIVLFVLLSLVLRRTM